MWYNNLMYEKNLEHIQRHYPELSAALKNIDISGRVEFFLSRDGISTVSIDRRTVYSRYHPLEGVRLSIEKSISADALNVIVMGFGLGYAVRELLNCELLRRKIYVIEPDLNVFKSIITETDISDLLSNPSVRFIVGRTPMEVFNDLSRDALCFCLKAPQVYISDAYAHIYRDYFAQLKPVIKDAYMTASSRIRDICVTGKALMSNSLLNLSIYLGSCGVKNFFNVLQGRPVFIVSAGPSLDKNIIELKKARSRGVIFCVDTAVGALAKYDIKPHFIVTGDYRDKARCFDKMPWADVPLLFHIETSPATITAYPGPRIAVASANPLPQLIDNMAGGRGRVEIGQCVAHLAFNVSVAMGAGLIVFVGQDYAFGSNTGYAAGTGREDVKDGRRCKINSLYDGSQLETKEEFYIYLRYIEERLSRLKVNAVNATEGGAGIRGCIQKDLALVIEELPQLSDGEIEIKDIVDVRAAACEDYDDNVIRGLLHELKNKIEAVISGVKELLNRDDRSQDDFTGFIEENRELLKLIHAYIMLPAAKVRAGMLRSKQERDTEFYVSVLSGLEDLNKILVLVMNNNML